MDATLPLTILLFTVGAIVVALTVVIVLRTHYRAIIREKNSGIMKLLRDQERLTQEIEYQTNKTEKHIIIK